MNRNGFMAICLAMAFATNVVGGLEDYQAKSSAEKLHILWGEIERSPWDPLPPLANNGWGSILKSMQSLFSLGLTFNHSSDILPKCREKFIHAFGNVAKIEFVPIENSPYGGIFKTGAEGLIRLSLAAAPKSLGGFVPGMAMKFLRDKKPSVNLMAMYSLEGQGKNHNFFANDFSHIIDPPTSFTLKMLDLIFSFTHSPSVHLPLEHLAAYDRYGNRSEEMKLPYQLIFSPADDVKDLMDETSDDDFRYDLAKIPSGSRLYEVWAIARQGGERHYIGFLKLTSGLLTSKFGDKQLFFQHHH